MAINARGREHMKTDLATDNFAI